MNRRTVRIPNDLDAGLVKFAKQHGMSVNDTVLLALHRLVNEESSDAGKKLEAIRLIVADAVKHS